MKVFTIFILFISVFYAQGQKKQKERSIFAEAVHDHNRELHSGKIRCASTEYESYLQKMWPSRLTEIEFEKWLSSKMDLRKNSDTLLNRSISTIINIPVVVHVVHNGDAYGTGENITDEQVLSQITVLNQDFRRILNTPGFNNSEVGADIEIEFCLAQTAPDGSETNGINRISKNSASWSETAIENTLKPETQWDPNQYFNIWVCRFGGDLTDVLGYAQFPDASALVGLESDGGEANTDGVVIGYQYFGSQIEYPEGDYDSTFNQGRTLTHEIGHCFGLRHIWGDNSSCTVNATDSAKDYCPDTPAASTATSGCPTNKNSCTTAAGNDMIENYMDYTNDSCMNIFTNDQKERILTVLENSPRRSSLKTSTVCQPPQVYEIDGALNFIELSDSCETAPTLQLKLENRGSSTINSAVINYSFDNQNVQEIQYTGQLLNSQIATISLNPQSFNAGIHSLSYFLSNVNNQSDQNSANDNKESQFTIIEAFNTSAVVITIQRDNYGSETTWNLKDQNGTTVASGGPYTDTNNLPALITQNVNVQNNNCYQFTISDSYGDGICCQFGNGYYNLKTDSGLIITSGNTFENEALANFRINSLTKEEIASEKLVKMYPNPAQDLVEIELSPLLTNCSLKVYNIIGQEVPVPISRISDTIKLNTQHLASGLYIVKLVSNEKTISLKLKKE
ncbi:M43 family zinc metalloprotease [Flavobacterium sp.]|uniref:M43 family zinc metalloprotease n=1 Tax=Flavobacterium sp. TaxID=239 RepID=UPI002639E58E|nr:M43 family zinc metalloprotease [Flavobacterium sp.]